MAPSSLLNGALKVNVKNATNVGKAEMSGKAHAMVRVTIGQLPPVTTNLEASVETGKHQSIHFQDGFNLTLNEMQPSDRVLVELLDREKQLLGFTNDTMDSITNLSYMSKNYELRDQHGSVNTRVLITFEWEPVVHDNNHMSKKQRNKKNGKRSTKQPTTIAPPAQSASSPIAATASADNVPESTTVPRSLATSPSGDEFYRSKFLRVGFYYDTSKNVYGYTKSFRLVAPLANFGESSLNYVLGKLGLEPIKSTAAIDQTVAPMIQTLDTSLDEKLAAVGGLLVQGQTQLLHTKDVALDKLVETKDKTVSTISDVASTTADSIAKAKNATVSTIAEVASTTADSITKAKNATVQTVSTASTATYQRVSGTAVYLISFVPLVGKRVAN